ncbi:MAG: ATP-binding protein [Bacilli bacterium]|jgi:tRNA(Ile)-lysidine synthase TilS/MesJ
MTREEEIAHSLTTTYRKRIWSKFCAAVDTYQLILPGDSIAVCISGGKDSNLLAVLLRLYKKYRDPKNTFSVHYLVMDPGYSDENGKKVRDNLKVLGIDARIVRTNIFEVANSQTQSPCYLCAKMRRGALYRVAKDMGCNKIALGHHYDDVIETTLMNLLNAGSFQTMLPKLHSDHYKGMEIIRPLYFVREKDIMDWRDTNSLSFIRCACRFTEAAAHNEETSQRLMTKNLIASLSKKNSQIEKNIFRSASNVVLDKVLGYKDSTGSHNYLDTYAEEGEKIDKRIEDEKIKPVIPEDPIVIEKEEGK